MLFKEQSSFTEVHHIEISFQSNLKDMENENQTTTGSTNILIPACKIFNYFFIIQ